jgi:hypothetical protein
MWVVGMSAVEAPPGLGLREGGVKSASGCDVKPEGIFGGEVWCVALCADPGFGAEEVKGEGELVIVPGAWSTTGLDEVAGVAGDEVEEGEGTCGG